MGGRLTPIATVVCVLSLATATVPATGIPPDDRAEGVEHPFYEELAAKEATAVPANVDAEVQPVTGGSPQAILGHLATLDHQIPAKRAEVTPTASNLDRLPDPLQRQIGLLEAHLTAARDQADLALGNLTPSERTRLATRAVELTEITGAAPPQTSRAMPRIDRADAIQGLLSKVDRSQLLAAELTLLSGVEQVLPHLGPVDASSTSSLETTCASGDVLAAAPTCRVIVGGSGPTTYHEDAALTVDLGGPDTYENNAGGSRNRTDGRFLAALALDLGDAPDVYNTTAGNVEGVQGGSVSGASLLVDEGGHDTYVVNWTGAPEEFGFNAAQGSGIVGTGVLWDLGGDDRYTAANYAQGIGVVGDGLLVDDGGTDRYLIPHTVGSEGGQGAGCIRGSGALVDLGSGDDKFNATMADQQGMGCAGGLGLLYGGAGNDTYIIRQGRGWVDGIGDDRDSRPSNMNGWSQGFGELGGVGILFDPAGHDEYISEEGKGFDGTLSQGVGVAAAGILRDLGGDDAYSAVISAQGYATAGIGLLSDASGDDTYFSRVEAQGIGNLGGTGALIDEDGTDRYSVVDSDPYGDTKECQGFSRTGVGLLVDTGGDEDTYNCPGGRSNTGSRGNDGYWRSGRGGLGVDT